MEYRESYKGYDLRITTMQADDGTWRSRAELLDSAGVTLEPDACGSEEEARRAALSVVAAEVDRRRARTGKP